MYGRYGYVTRGNHQVMFMIGQTPVPVGPFSPGETESTRLRRYSPRHPNQVGPAFPSMEPCLEFLEQIFLFPSGQLALEHDMMFSSRATVELPPARQLGAEQLTANLSLAGQDLLAPIQIPTTPHFISILCVDVVTPGKPDAVTLQANSLSKLRDRGLPLTWPSLFFFLY